MIVIFVVESCGKIGKSLGNSSLVPSVIDTVEGVSVVDLEEIVVGLVVVSTLSPKSTSSSSQAEYLQLADSFSSPVHFPPFLGKVEMFFYKLKLIFPIIMCHGL